MAATTLTRTALTAATRCIVRRSAPNLPRIVARSSISPLARTFSSTVGIQHGGITRPPPGSGITIHFVDPKGEPLKTVSANEGDDLLSIAHEYDIDLEGACEGSIACSTCHVILEPDVFDSLEEPCDDENDMLDLAFGLTDTSRLGCQVKVTKQQDGMKVQLPAATRNMYVDGHKAGHH
ncbi:putative ferredoxin [Mycosarcoma maydis]|uniref:Ferredoxin n=1 Tax=Mycosarcoma maydis TaxID=5270 RepID=A0A0D1E4C9_MYCMD|nr:putative ferredoxin [Ustilago maydis 521]KIS70929.1 putative ferredoxin [Ustilago maydis 521]|eukprot:XP_011387381.1 putative ferredoxin [Ustilago maydis 521]